MPPKVLSSTTSSTSATSKKKSIATEAEIHLNTPLQFLKGVGPRYAAILESRGLKTVRDMLLYLPRDYQDRTTIRPIQSLKPDETVLVRGYVSNLRSIPIRSLKQPLLEATLADQSGRLALKWFRYQRGYFESQFKKQPQVLVYGQIKSYNGRLEILHPEIEYIDAEDDHPETPGIIPIYVEPEGLNQRLIRKIILKSLEAVCEFEDDVPAAILQKNKLLPIREAVQKIHSPLGSLEDLKNYKSPEQKRLIFDDLFKFEWVIGRRRFNIRKESCEAYSKTAAKPLLEKLQSKIPFEMTEDQISAIDRIYEDLDQTKSMNRLLQGDVGCGKTLVALAAALPVIAGGGQVAMLAPTEILAEQHLQNALRYLDGINTALLVGSTTKSQREKLLEDLKCGNINLLIGTHALLEPSVAFQKLGLVIIDEQHRFGVDQRMKLKSKGKNPHMLSLTATPIPRTLALTAYGDLDVTTIKQLPKGRPTITTKMFQEKERESLYKKVCTELKKGRQAYIIYPLVEESEKMDLANAVQGAEDLANGVLHEFKVGLLHGKMKPQEKGSVMADFKAGKTQVLVSTTVVEVGVDVPNATVLIIENAERFGLSQLHQLRGRVGRGTEESFCFLSVSRQKPGENSFERLSAMEQTRDGFRLAELDLKIRGPGEFLGTKQSGELSFPCANLIRDQDILIEARQAAFELLRKDPDLEKSENLALRQYMLQSGTLQQARFETA